MRRLILALIYLFLSAMPAWAQLPVCPDQYQPVENYAIRVSGGHLAEYWPTWVGQTSYTSTGVMISTAPTFVTLDTTGGAFTVTLEPAIQPTGTTGKVHLFKWIAGSMAPTIAAASGDTIDGLASESISTLQNVIGVESDGSHTWRVITNSGGGGGGGGTVTNVSAPTGNWPAFLVPSIANPTTTPVISVALSSTVSGPSWFGVTTTTGTPGFQTGLINNALINWASPSNIGTGTAANGTFASLIATSAFSFSGTVTGSLPLANIAQGGATAGQVMTWNGTTWVPVNSGLVNGGAKSSNFTAAVNTAYSVTGAVTCMLPTVSAGEIDVYVASGGTVTFNTTSGTIAGATAHASGSLVDGNVGDYWRFTDVNGSWTIANMQPGF